MNYQFDDGAPAISSNGLSIIPQKQYFPVMEIAIEYDHSNQTLRALANKDGYRNNSYPLPPGVYEVLCIGVEKNYLNIFYRQQYSGSETRMVRATLNEGVITYY